MPLRHLKSAVLRLAQMPQLRGNRSFAKARELPQFPKRQPRITIRRRQHHVANNFHLRTQPSRIVFPKFRPHASVELPPEAVPTPLPLLPHSWPPRPLHQICNSNSQRPEYLASIPVAVFSRRSTHRSSSPPSSRIRFSRTKTSANSIRIFVSHFLHVRMRPDRFSETHIDLEVVSSTRPHRIPALSRARQ